MERRPLPPLRDGVMVAAGDLPVVGRWRMFTYESERLADSQTGEVYQPAGLPCLGLALLDSAGVEPATFGGQCGEFPRTPGFSRVQHTVRDANVRPLQIVVYGRTPEDTAYVRLTAKGRPPVAIEPLEGPRVLPLHQGARTGSTIPHRRARFHDISVRSNWEHLFVST